MTTTQPRPIMLLPGMAGHGAFWEPVASQLTAYGHRCIAFDWPGLGGNPAHAGVNGFDDLVTMVAETITEPAAIVGQSMGGYIALKLALARPELVSHLVLAVTSAGIDMTAHRATDWRPGSRAAHPDAPDWAFVATPDMTEAIRTVDVPTQLLWASHDEISPVSVGLRLLELFPKARLTVFDSDDHWVAHAHSVEVAQLIHRLVGTDH